jgi:hypothetical protein
MAGAVRMLVSQSIMIPPVDDYMERR